MALLLPKLRSYFAEFLNHSSLDRLGIFYLSTCVGLGYGRHQHSLEVFLESRGFPTSLMLRHQISGFTKDGFTYLSPYILERGRPEPRSDTFLRHSIGKNALVPVQECLPVVHRLRLSASP